jgi:hypothetical protein
MIIHLESVGSFEEKSDIFVRFPRPLELAGCQ